MDWSVVPYMGVGRIMFGMTRDQIRKLLGSEVKEFKKTPTSKVLTDAFDQLGVHVYYKNDDTCEAIEMARPANPKLNGSKIIGLPFFEVREFMQKLDDSLEIDETGLISFKLGIGLFVPSLTEIQREIVESVIVFQRGYYD